MASFKQKYLQLKSHVDHLINNTEFPLRVQKIYSTEHFIHLECRQTGKTQHLYLGRGSNFEGFYVWEKKPLADARRQDKFLEYLRRNLRGQKIESINLAEADRYIRMEIKGLDTSYMGFFWKGPKLNFYHLYPKNGQFEVFYSTGNKELFETDDEFLAIEKVESSMEIRTEGEFKEAKPSATYADYEKYYQETFLKKSVDKRKQKRQLRKIDKVKTDLNKLNELLAIEKYTDEKFKEELESIGELKKAGKKIIFGSKNYYQKRDIIFNKLKNYRKNIERQQKVIQTMESSLDDEANFKVTKTAKLIKVFDYKKDLEKNKTNEITQDNHKIFQLNTGEKVLLGLSAAGNDFIRNKLANKSDIWMHLESYTSPHAIIKNLKSAKPDIELITVVASIIRDFSDHDITQIPVEYTEVKNLKGLKGSPGSVIFKKAKYITVSYDANWRHNNLL